MTTDTQLAPTDAEIEALGHRMCWRYTPAANQFRGSTHTFNRTTLLNFTRAALARWGQPSGAGEPVAWLDPWAGTKVTTDYDAYGKHGIPLYTAPRPVEREPLSPERVKEIVLDAGYDQCDIPDSERAAFIEGLRHGEQAHGIKGGQHGTE